MTDLLIVDDDPIFCAAAGELARDRGAQVRLARSVAQAREELGRGPVDLLALDLQLPDGSGIELLQHLSPSQAGRVVVITGHPTLDSAVRAVAGPVTEYLLKPLCPDRWDALVRGALSAAPPDPVSTGAGALLGNAPAMRETRELLARVAPTSLSVMLSGETGTGKELSAQALHRLSGRIGPIVPLNCAAVPSELLGSQLFGHERGSFTGAVQRHIGALERASHGTIFLDEITEMPLALQAYLLRALETGVVTRLGGSEPIHVPVRVIAATNRDPVQAVAEGRLRQDLYYRLADVCIHMPALRQRPDDIVPLAKAFLNQLNAQHGRDKRLSPKCLAALHAHRWPGNVRELRSAVRRAFLLTDADQIEVIPFSTTVLPPEDDDEQIAFRVGTTLAEMEERALRKTLAHYNYDKQATARALGISVRTVHNHLARWERRRTGTDAGHAQDDDAA